VLLAAADRSDPAHEACRDLLESYPGPLITTEPVLAETGWLLDRQLGPAAEAALYRSVADGELVVEPLSRRLDAHRRADRALRRPAPRRRRRDQERGRLLVR
jgi:uncharacterized protein